MKTTQLKYHIASDTAYMHTIVVHIYLKELYRFTILKTSDTDRFHRVYDRVNKLLRSGKLPRYLYDFSCKDIIYKRTRYGFKRTVLNHIS